MSKIYYKVVFYDRKDNRYFSCIHILKNDSRININNLIVEYKINEWVKPNIKETSLMCFDDLESAKAFIDYANIYSGIIFTCKIKQPHKKYKLFESAVRRFNFLDLFTKLLNQKKKKKKIEGNIGSAPPGTTFCKELMLLEEVS